MDIGKSIRVASAMADRDTKWLSRQLEMSVSRVNQLKNQDKVNTSTLERLADVFNMQVSEFVALGE